MISNSDYPARGWDVIPCFSKLGQIPYDLIDEMEKHPEAAGKSSWGTRNLLFSLVLSMRPKLILEIGAHIGSASIVIGSALKANNFGKLVCLEPQKHFYELLCGFIEKAGLGEFVYPLKILSTEINPSIHLGEKADFIFLDANHSYSNALKDIELSYSFLSENGLLILDDVGPTRSAEICGEKKGGVRKALLDYVASHDDLKVIFLEPPFWLNPCGIALVCKQNVI
jgi:predicted O-methyltransferase YrrM